MENPTLVECPYLPDGFAVMEDARGFVVIDLTKLVCFRVPKITLETLWGPAIKYEGDKVTGELLCKINIES